jgi:hypothetical protein
MMFISGMQALTVTVNVSKTLELLATGVVVRFWVFFYIQHLRSAPHLWPRHHFYHKKR